MNGRPCRAHAPVYHPECVACFDGREGAELELEQAEARRRKATEAALGELVGRSSSVLMADLRRRVPWWHPVRWAAGIASAYLRFTLWRIRRRSNPTRKDTPT